jgi:hypothetical protein
MLSILFLLLKIKGERGPVYSMTTYSVSGGTAPIVAARVTRCCLASRPLPPLPFSLNSRMTGQQRLFGHFGKEKNAFPPQGFEPIRILALHRARNTVPY